MIAALRERMAFLFCRTNLQFVLIRMFFGYLTLALLFALIFAGEEGFAAPAQGARGLLRPGLFWLFHVLLFSLAIAALSGLTRLDDKRDHTAPAPATRAEKLLFFIRHAPEMILFLCGALWLILPARVWENAGLIYLIWFAMFCLIARGVFTAPARMSALVSAIRIRAHCAFGLICAGGLIFLLRLADLYLAAPFILILLVLVAFVLSRFLLNLHSRFDKNFGKDGAPRARRR